MNPKHGGVRFYRAGKVQQDPAWLRGSLNWKMGGSWIFVVPGCYTLEPKEGSAKQNVRRAERAKIWPLGDFMR